MSVCYLAHYCLVSWSTLLTHSFHGSTSRGSSAIIFIILHRIFSNHRLFSKYSHCSHVFVSLTFWSIFTTMHYAHSNWRLYMHFATMFLFCNTLFASTEKFPFLQIQNDVRIIIFNRYRKSIYLSQKRKSRMHFHSMWIRFSHFTLTLQTINSMLESEICFSFSL